jgi:hypothetical protein
MVSATFPCVTGPYTAIHCKLQLLKSAFRRSTDLPDGDYDRQETDTRFVDDRKIHEAIVTSTGQNDFGLFEPGMRDERYLPFEGAGAISRWRLELPTGFKAFDYTTISDVILHVRYTAKEGGQQLRTKAAASVANLLRDEAARPLFRLFSLRHEFPSEWHRFTSAPASAMTVDLAAGRFPYLTQGRTIVIRQAEVIVRTKSDPPPEVRIVPGTEPPDPADPPLAEASPGPWTIGMSPDATPIQDIFVVLRYTIEA